MSAPLSISVNVQTPSVEGQPDCPFPLSLTTQYDHLTKHRLTFTGSGSKSVDFGSLATGAKAVLVTVDADTSPSAAPITFAVNGGTDAIEVSPGGFALLGSPSPTASGITAMDITYTASVKMYVWIFG